MIIPILHRDDRLVLVDKPSGLVVHRGWADDDGGVLVALRDQLGQRVWPLHRLDRGTSGVLAFALDDQTASVVGQAFADGRVAKKYLALVRGHPAEQLIIDHPIPAEPDGPRVPAVTEIRRLGTWERYALVEAIPHTGRLHQIRRHLKHIACPLIGDVNYGKGEHNRIFRERFGLHRLALHALSLRLPGIDGGAPVYAFAAPSGTLADCLRAMELLAVVPARDR
ncbi:MAG TPA: pseudouridine synthase [Polyangia bacterium]